MRRSLAVIALALSLWPTTASAGELTLRDVIELHRTGMGDDLLIAVIEADGGPFQLSFADIHDLKGGGFSERLISALVRTGRRDVPATQAPPVVVRQDVYAPNFAPTLVYAPTVVLAPPSPRAAGSETRPYPSRRRDDGRDTPPARREKPRATWVTPKAK